MRATLSLALVSAFMAMTVAPLAPIAAQVQPGSADARLKALYEKEWTWRQKEFARLPDDESWSAGDDHFPRIDPAAQQARIVYWQKILADLAAVPVDQLSAEEQINATVLRTSLEAFVEDGKYRAWEMPFNADSNFWSGIVPRTAYTKPEQVRRYLGRMADLPRYFDDQIANMRAGLARGFSVPRVTLAGRDASIVAYTVADPEKNPFYDPFRKLPATLSAAEQEQLRKQARDLIARSVVPAYVKLLDFYRGEYLARTRTSLAAEKMPDGAAFYQAQIRQYTTLPLTAVQIHEIGLKEVARITAEMEGAKTKAGFTGTLDAFKTFLRTDPQFYAKTPDELMGVSAYVAVRMDGELKNTIGFLPRYRFTIRPVPDAIAPFYTAGRGGLESCLMNTHNLPSRPLYQIPALTLHECVPGHSFQAAVVREGPARPDFRKQTYFSGYGEGWGLYTEWLGTVAGIYRTPYEDFGRLSYEMWRASRLVIDTGIHHYGWTRDRAITYLLSNTALSRHEVETEVDRYISWPGQALAYKLGELTIRRKRAEAEAKLGASFDQRWFHDLILNLGSVPLPTLEQQIDQWISAGGPNTLAGRR